MSGRDDPRDGTAATTADRREAARRVLPAVAQALVLGARFLFVTGRLAVVTVAVVGRAVLDEGRRARARRWFLLDGNRWVIGGGLTLGVLVGTFLLTSTGVLGVEQSSFVTTMFSAVISGLFSFVPIVVTVNQLTVSRVVGSISDIRTQMSSAREFQRQIAALDEDTAVVSSDPAPFLEHVFDLEMKRARALQEAVEAEDDPLRTDVREYVDVLLRQAADVTQRLDGGRRRLSQLLVPMMGDNYPQNVQDAKRIRSRYGDELDEEARSLLEDLADLSVSLDLLRQYYKAMYVQQELSRLSRWVGYTGIGSFLVAILVVMGFAHGQPFPGWPVALDLAVSVAVATAVAPFAVLVAFVVRIATIAERTAAPGPFTPLRETPAYARHRDD